MTHETHMIREIRKTLARLNELRTYAYCVDKVDDCRNTIQQILNMANAEAATRQKCSK